MQLDLIFITVFVSGEKVIKYVGVSDKIDGNWNERKPPFLTMYVLFLCRDENAYHKFHIKITSYSHELIHIYCAKSFVTNFTLKLLFTLMN